ncbi:NAD(P)-binding protein [Patellaria atrata CBS 101060]|uniref:NAD(P)-binding protein n=1 Tax=Patellaria atrata CBS 101060 TaxID=1346257 RepID=A0A9P4VWZ7_9PEZI|nr:NAD(P)-binding protein [Patellaria atrata CBS 101060]
MANIKVLLVGATGETGSAIVQGLLASKDPKYDISALVRPGSMDKPAATSLKESGVKTIPGDVTGSQDDLVKALSGNDVVISSMFPFTLDLDFVLADACKLAGVKRFVPCWWGPVLPRGRNILGDKKWAILDHIKKIGLPYTKIDVGWWQQLTIPKLLSGRTDYMLLAFAPSNTLLGDGNVPSALTNKEDIGHYVARIIGDPRTLNQQVLAYTEVLTPNEQMKISERISGEKIEPKYTSAESIAETIESAEKDVAENPHDIPKIIRLVGAQYQNSWGLQGDNTPENAKKLGYLLTSELYPDYQGIRFETLMKDVVEGKAKKIYEGRF